MTYTITFTTSTLFGIAHLALVAVYLYGMVRAVVKNDGGLVPVFVFGMFLSLITAVLLFEGLCS